MPLIPALGGRGKWLSEFEVQASFRAFTHRNPVLENQKKKKKKKKKKK